MYDDPKHRFEVILDIWQRFKEKRKWKDMKS